MGFRRIPPVDSYRPGPRRNSYGRDSPRPAGGGSQSRHRRRSNSQQASPPRGHAASHPWNHSGRNFTAPGWSYHQHDASRHGDQRAEGVSSGALGEITNQSPLPSPRARPGRSRSRDEYDEDSLFVGDGPSPEAFEDCAEPEPKPLPRPKPAPQQTENQGGQSEFPEAFHRRPEPISASKSAHGHYFPPMARFILSPLTAQPAAARTGENILKPRYISTTSIPIETPKTQPETASKKPVTPKTAASIKAAPLARAVPSSKAAAPLKAIAPPTSGTGLPPKPHVHLPIEKVSDCSTLQVSRTLAVKTDSSPPFPPSLSSRMTTSGDDKSADQEPQQSVHCPVPLSTTNLRPPDQPRPEKKPDPKPSQASTRSIQKRKVGDAFAAHDLKMIWNQCFEHRQAPDVSRLGHFALPIPSHSLHLVSPAQLERAKRYVIPGIIRFEVTPLQPGGENSPIDPARARLFCISAPAPPQDMGEDITPAYHKLQLRPSTSQTDGLAWPVLRAMQLSWELTARWYKEVIVDWGWVSLGRLDREDTVMPDAMDIDGDDEHGGKNISHEKNTGMGLGDFVANELKKNVVKTKHSWDEPRGSADIDEEIRSWLQLQHLGREQD
ncbi:hypothetical protein QBC32DRAFT_393350, partial [Pseudoneurospora amorphoporcata]